MNKRQSEANDQAVKVSKINSSTNPSSVILTPNHNAPTSDNQTPPPIPNSNSPTSNTTQLQVIAAPRKPLFNLSKTQQNNLKKFHDKTREYIDATNFESLHGLKVIKIQANEMLGNDLVDAVYYLEKEKLVEDIDMTQSRVLGTPTNKIFYLAVKSNESVAILKKLVGAYPEVLGVNDVGVHYRVLTRTNTMLTASEIGNYLKGKEILVEGVTLSGPSCNLYFSTFQDAINYRNTYPKLDLPGATLFIANYGTMTNSGKIYGISFSTGKDSIPVPIVQDIFNTFLLKPLAIFPTEKATHHVYLTKHDYLVFHKYAFPLMLKLRTNLDLKYTDLVNRTYNKTDKNTNNNDDFSNSLLQSDF